MVYADEYVKGIGLRQTVVMKKKVAMRIQGGEGGEKQREEQKRKSKKEHGRALLLALFLGFLVPSF